MIKTAFDLYLEQKLEDPTFALEYLNAKFELNAITVQDYEAVLQHLHKAIRSAHRPTADLEELVSLVDIIDRWERKNFR